MEETVRKFLPLTDNANEVDRRIDWKQVPLRLQHAVEGDNPVNTKMGTFAECTGHNVEWVINGQDYFNRLLTEMDYLIANNDGAIFWMHGWYYQLFKHASVIRLKYDSDLPPSIKKLENSSSWRYYHEDEALNFQHTGTLFADKLKAMHDAGVDVRIIGWLNPILLKSSTLTSLAHLSKPCDKPYKIGNNQTKLEETHSVFNRITATLYSLLRLRNGYLDPKKVIFNTLCHPVGGAHTKLVVAGNSSYLCAYTGGIDAAPSRNKLDWSDAAVRIEGTAATYIGNFFKNLWDEIAGAEVVNLTLSASKYREVQEDEGDEIAPNTYPSHFGTTIPIRVQQFAARQAQEVTQTYVQIFRTLPRKNYEGQLEMEKFLKGFLGKVGGLKLYDGRQKNMESFLKDIQSLKYVYTPTISFAPYGVFEYKANCFRAISQAKEYIFIMDQYLFNEEMMRWINYRVRSSIEHGGTPLRIIMGTWFLYPELGDDGVNIRKQRVGKRIKQSHSAMTSGIPKNRWNEIFMWMDLKTHGKIILVDDTYLSIGSANFARRSFYTDIEMGAAIVDPVRVKQFRKDIFKWCLTNAADAVIPDGIQDALGIWFPKARKVDGDIDYGPLQVRFELMNEFNYPTVKDEEELTNRFNNPDSNLAY